MSERYKFKSPTEIKPAVWRLVQKNLAIMQRTGYLSIFNGKVQYRPEPKGENFFKDIWEVIQDGYGDCEDLTAALMAMCIFLGYTVEPLVPCERVAPSKYECHVLMKMLLRGQWKEIDPSMMLGMWRYMKHDPGIVAGRRIE